MSPTLEFFMLVFMFIARLVVPFVLIFGVLYLLQRWLEPRLTNRTVVVSAQSRSSFPPALVAAGSAIAIMLILYIGYMLATNQFISVLLMARDAVVLAYLFALRVMVPIGVLVLGGKWLERKLHPELTPEISTPLIQRFPILQRIQLPRLSGRALVAVSLVALLWTAGIGLTVVRFFFGLGYMTNMSDASPWGIWIGFDVVSGVALAAGGFVLAGTVHVFNLKRFQPIVRPAILTALLGYLLVIVGLLFDLGRWYNVWHPMFMWNLHSPLLEVAWCVILYTTVLALEFSPIIFERFKLDWPLKVMRAITIPLVILGMCLSTLHQSSLGTLFLIFPEKINPLWYSPLLPVFFFLSAVIVGLGMTIVESNLSARAFGKELESDLLADLGRAAGIVLVLYFALKVVDLIARGATSYLLVPGFHSALYYIEMGLGVIAPMLILLTKRGRANPRIVYASAWLIVGGVILNRLNTALLGWASYAGAGPYYIPSVGEITISVFLLSLGVVGFGLIAKNLPVFTHQAEPMHA